MKTIITLFIFFSMSQAFADDFRKLSQSEKKRMQGAMSLLILNNSFTCTQTKGRVTLSQDALTAELKRVALKILDREENTNIIFRESPDNKRYMQFSAIDKSVEYNNQGHQIDVMNAYSLRVPMTKDDYITMFRVYFNYDIYNNETGQSANEITFDADCTFDLK